MVDHVGVTTGPTTTHLVTGDEAVVGTETTMEDTGIIMGMGDTVGDTREGEKPLLEDRRIRKDEFLVMITILIYFMHHLYQLKVGCNVNGK